MIDIDLESMEDRKTNWWFYAYFTLAWLNVFIGYILWDDLVHSILLGVMIFTALLVLGHAIHAHIKGRAYWYFGVRYYDTLGMSLEIRRKYTKRQLGIIIGFNVLITGYAIPGIIFTFDFSYTILYAFFVTLCTWALLYNQRYILKIEQEV